MFHSEQTPLLPRLEEVSAFDEALTSGKVYVLLFGLSIHSLFEGLGNCFIFSSTSGSMSGSASVFTFKGSPDTLHFIFESLSERGGSDIERY